MNYKCAGWRTLGIGVVLALALNIQPVSADSSAFGLSEYENIAAEDFNVAVPLPVELKAEVSHSRPPMSHHRRGENRPVRNVLPEQPNLMFQPTTLSAPTSAPSVEQAFTTNNASTLQPNANKTVKIRVRSRQQAETVAQPSLTFDPATVKLNDMQTAWGYGPRENQYNDAILKATQQNWPHQNVPLHPLLFKSLVANESAFNPTAVSYTGATGLVQLTPETMRRFGLTWSTSRNPQYAVPAGVKVLAEKARVVLEPQNYTKITGLNPARCPYAKVVAEAYQKLGDPTPEQSWYLVLAAYNAGGGTILRAMAKAYKQGRDPREWDELVGDPKKPQTSPLYQACREIFPNSASVKYKEVSAYPGKIIKLYRRNQIVAI